LTKAERFDIEASVFFYRLSQPSGGIECSAISSGGRAMKAGIIYFARMKDAVVGGFREPVKVGKTANLMKRKRGYSGYPSKVAIIHTIVTNHAVWLEQRFHKKFSRKRLRGEWFRIGDEDLKEARQIKVLDQVPQGFGFLIDGFLRWKNPLQKATIFSATLTRPETGEDAAEELKAGGWKLSYPQVWHRSGPVFMTVAEGNGNVICIAADSLRKSQMRAWARAASLRILKLSSVPI
jgi:hypothetical protein